MARVTGPRSYSDPMSQVPRPPTGDEGELGGLLVLLQGAAYPFRTVQATYRTSRHAARLGEAFRADTEERKRRGARIRIVPLVRSGDPGPPETEETLRIWREGQRVREEHHGGQRDGNYSVADGPLWWVWTEHTGATSNQNDPSVGGGVGQELQVMLNPTPLLILLRFRVAGHSQVAGRATVTAHATPYPQQDPRLEAIFPFVLHQLGSPADHYELEVDQERGVLLAVTAFRDEQPCYQITALAIEFDEPIPAETFQFTPPEGEEIQPTRARERLRQMTLAEAQQRATFTVLMPDRVPANWQVHCLFSEASQRPPLAARVSLIYHADDGHQSISISQMAAADAAHQYWNMIDNEDWQEVARDGTSVRVRPAESPQAQAQIERDGTFVFLVSDYLTGDQLVTIAAGLRPAPSGGSI